jgi:hypothetical protein
MALTCTIYENDFNLQKYNNEYQNEVERRYKTRIGEQTVLLITLINMQIMINFILFFSALTDRILVHLVAY